MQCRFNERLLLFLPVHRPRTIQVPIIRCRCLGPRWVMRCRIFLLTKSSGCGRCGFFPEHLLMMMVIATINKIIPSTIRRLEWRWGVVSYGWDQHLVPAGVYLFPNPRQRFAWRIWSGTIQVSRSRWMPSFIHSFIPSTIKNHDGVFCRLRSTRPVCTVAHSPGKACPCGPGLGLQLHRQGRGPEQPPIAIVVYLYTYIIAGDILVIIL